MSIKTAKARLQKWVDDCNANRITYWDGKQDEEIAICESYTEKPYGFLFKVDLKSVVSGEREGGLVGNSLIIVRTDVPEIHFLAPKQGFYPLDEYEAGDMNWVDVVLL